MGENNVINIRTVMAEIATLNISPEAIDEMREMLTAYIWLKTEEIEENAKAGYDNREKPTHDKMRTIKRRHFSYREVDETQGIAKLEAAVRRLKIKGCPTCPEVRDMLKINQEFVKAIIEQYPELAADERVDMLSNTNKSLLKKMGVEE